MKLDEHKSIVTELMSDNIEPTRRTELLMKLGDDYGITQAELTEKTTQLETATKNAEYYSSLSQKLWLENSANLKEITSNVTTKTEEQREHQPKRTFQNLISKF